MSHIAVYKTTLGDINTDILNKALEVLSLEENDLEIRNYIEDYYGNKHSVWQDNKIIGAIFSRELRKGVGVSIDKQGHLIFASHDRGPALEKVKAGVEQTYKLIALINALQEMGYEVSMLNETKNAKVLEGELAAQRITVEIDNKSFTTDLDGFIGNKCYTEAQKLAEELQKLGVNVDMQGLQPKEEDRLEIINGQQQRE